MPRLNPPPISLEDAISRRNFLKFVVFSGLISCSAKFSLAAIDELAIETRSLSIYNPNTKESFEGTYYSDGKYVAAALNKINHLMRDTNTNEVKSIDTGLLDLISAIATKLKSKSPFHIISGYRSPKTNSLLRKRGQGAAKNSYHIKGQAADLRLPGFKSSAVRKAAYRLKKGGVGYYAKRGFVHIDVGPVRYWRG